MSSFIIRVDLRIKAELMHEHRSEIIVTVASRTRKKRDNPFVSVRRDLCDLG